MNYGDQVTEFDGLEVYEYNPEQGLRSADDGAPMVRVEYDSDTNASDLLKSLLNDPKAEELTHLLLGAWSAEMYETPPTEELELLAAGAEKLPNLRSLFIAAVEQMESEISWIVLGDISTIWSTFPKLTTLAIRGSQNLKLGTIEHNHLETLTIECGGLPKNVLAELASAKLPALRHLDLYLGTSEYGFDGGIEDVEPLLAPGLFPNLKHLALRDSMIADDVAKLVASTPLPEGLEVLDMSLGSLSDEGGNALLASEGIKKLQVLDLHWHYLSPKVATRLLKLPLTVNLTDPQTPDTYGGETYRYIAVSE